MVLDRCSRALLVLAGSLAMGWEGAPGAAAQTRVERQAGITLFTDLMLELHPAPYRLHSAVEWREAIATARTRADTADEAGLFVELSRLAGMLGDGHSYVWVDNDSPLLGTALELALWRFSDGVFIRAAAPGLADLVGARVDAIGGVPIDEALHRLVEARPGENEWMAAKSSVVLMRIPAYLRSLGLADSDDEAVLTLTMPSGERLTRTVAAAPQGNLSTVWDQTLGLRTPEGWRRPAAADSSRWMGHRAESYWYEYLPSARTVYVQFNRSSRGPSPGGEDPWIRFVSEVFELVDSSDADRLVIDLRHNNGGDSSMWQALTHAVIRRPRIDRPGHLFVLTSRLTESGAAVVATKLETQTNALFVGEPPGTAPNYFNDPRPGRLRDVFHVPGSGINLRVSRVVEQRSNYLDRRRAIFPDVPVALSYGQFEAGRDPVLDAALAFDPADGARHFAYADGTAIIEPWEHPWRASQDGAWPPR